MIFHRVQCGSWIAFGAGPSGCQLFAPPTILHAMGYNNIIIIIIIISEVLSREICEFQET